MFKIGEEVNVDDFYNQMARRTTIAIPKCTDTVAGTVVRPWHIANYWLIRVHSDGKEIVAHETGIHR